jgi:predicted ArsR family transcriptional regulator
VHVIRKHILEILKEENGATVAELAEKLAMAPVSVRHHLDILQGDNLICVERIERKGHVGRPQLIYALTEGATSYFPNNFAALASNLVRQLKQILPQEQVECAFRSLAHELAGEMGREELAEAPFEMRLERVTAFLNERGYLAHWERAGNNPEDGYLLHKCNCPYAGVAGQHAELCLMDQTLIDDLLGKPCKRTQSMIANQRCCTYQIGNLNSTEIMLVG